MFSKKTIIITFIVCIPMLILACSGGKMDENKTQYQSVNDVPASTWEALSKKNIYFGHHSVGKNIIQGINELSDEYPEIKLNIVETTDLANQQAGVFAHSKVGENADPASKIKAFDNFVNNGIGKKADIAMFKLCYVDITQGTNVQEVFANYTQAMDRLKSEYPNVKFVHITSPLRSVKIPWKRRLKNFLNGKKNPTDINSNALRNEYNVMLREKYGSTDPIFDLADAEATYPDGKKETYEKDGKTYYAMVQDYTYDGGHLNKVGRRQLAERFLLTLINL